VLKRSVLTSVINLLREKGVLAHGFSSARRQQKEEAGSGKAERNVKRTNKGSNMVREKWVDKNTTGR
jgi:hypothetical protein